jgi:hypothetical protein
LPNSSSPTGSPYIQVQNWVPNVCEFHQVNSLSRKFFIAAALENDWNAGLLPPHRRNVQRRKAANLQAKSHIRRRFC